MPKKPAVGGTGKGKSKLFENIIRQFIDHDAGAIVLIDPSDTADQIKRYCYQKGIDDDLIVISPHAVFKHRAFVSLNPIRARGMPQRRAQLMTNVFRSVMGNQEFFQTPLLARWIYNVACGLVYSGLSMRETLRLLSRGDNRWRVQVQEHIPLDDVREDWQELSSIWNEGDRRLFRDETLSSVNRFRQYLQNPHVEYMLSGTKKTVDWHQVVDEHKIVIVDLADRDDVIGPEEQKMFGMQVLEDMCASLRQRPETDRAECYIFIDELSMFVSQAITWILNYGRKFGIRMLGGFQYINQLIDVVRNDPSAFDAMLTNCDLRMVFGGGVTAEDARRFAEEMYQPFLDPYKVKQEILTARQTTQQVMKTIHSKGRFHARALGKAITEMESRGTMESSIHGDSSGTGDGTSSLMGSGQSTATPPDGGLPMVTDMSSMAHGTSSAFFSGSSDAYASGSAESTGRAESESEVESAGQTESETVVPVNVPSEVFYESRLEFQDIDEQMFECVARMLRMKKRDGVLSIKGHQPVEFRTAEVKPLRLDYEDGLDIDQEYYRDQIAIAYTIEEVKEEIAEREREFLQRAPRSSKTVQQKKRARDRAKSQDLLTD